jgi:O-succinylbenzoic acid--CoA ligase
MHPSFTFEIGNELFSGQQLIDLALNNKLAFKEEWQKSVVSFLKQWFNTSDEVLVQTSGSTGKPQMIHLSKAKMRASASMTCDYFGLKPLDRALLCLSAENIAGKMMLVRAMVRGLHLIAVNPVGCPLSDIKGKVKFSAMVPLQIQHCLESNCLDKTEIVLIGGVAISNKMHEELLKQTVSCYISYGMTETMSHVALKKLNGQDASDWYEALDDIQFSLDERGCLQIHATRLGVENLQTNDLCELKGTHQFRWLGRFDFVINSGGVKVNPEQLEKLLSPYILFPFFITGTPSEKFGEQIVLFIEAPSMEQIPVHQIQQIIKDWPKYKRPKDIFYFTKFVYTSSGKINRNATKLGKGNRVS